MKEQKSILVIIVFALMNLIICPVVFSIISVIISIIRLGTTNLHFNNLVSYLANTAVLIISIFFTIEVITAIFDKISISRINKHYSILISGWILLVIQIIFGIINIIGASSIETNIALTAVGGILIYASKDCHH